MMSVRKSYERLLTCYEKGMVAIVQAPMFAGA